VTWGLGDEGAGPLTVLFGNGVMRLGDGIGREDLAGLSSRQSGEVQSKVKKHEENQPGDTTRRFSGFKHTQKEQEQKKKKRNDFSHSLKISPPVIHTLQARVSLRWFKQELEKPPGWPPARQLSWKKHAHRKNRALEKSLTENLIVKPQTPRAPQGEEST